jgi:hypothetical protein
MTETERPAWADQKSEPDGAESERHPAWLLADPFPLLSRRAAVIVTGVVALASLGMSRLHVRFDGAVDLHVVPIVPSPALAVADLVASLGAPALLLWAASRLFAKKGDFLDFLLLVGVARLPLVASGLIFALLVPSYDWLLENAQRPTNHVLFLGLTLLSFIGFAWFVLWLYRGYKRASGLGALVGGASFAAVLAVAEIVTKLVLPPAVPHAQRERVQIDHRSPPADDGVPARRQSVCGVPSQHAAYRSRAFCPRPLVELRIGQGNLGTLTDCARG